MTFLPIRALALATLPLLLAACGGGSDEPCGAQSQRFSVSFAQNTYTLKWGPPATIESTLQPESCRNDMHFSANAQNFPPGLSLARGNVVGTPTQQGTYQLQLTINEVAGYMGFGVFNLPRSNLVTVNVLP